MRKQVPKKDHVAQPSVWCRRFCRVQWLYIDLHCDKISMNSVTTAINPSQQYAGLREAILVTWHLNQQNHPRQNVGGIIEATCKRSSTNPHGATPSPPCVSDFHLQNHEQEDQQMLRPRVDGSELGSREFNSCLL